MKIYIRVSINMGASGPPTYYAWTKEQWTQAKAKIDSGGGYEEVLEGSGLPLDMDDCPSCGGSGILLLDGGWYYHPRYGHQSYPDMMQTCPVCERRGWVADAEATRKNMQRMREAAKRLLKRLEKKA